MKVFIILGAINALLAVGLGAFGAHGLEGKIPDKYLQVWHTGVQYHMYHALGLFVVAFLADKLSGIGSVTTAGWLMFAGIVLFSGSLYSKCDANLHSWSDHPARRCGVYYFLDYDRCRSRQISINKKANPHHMSDWLFSYLGE